MRRRIVWPSVMASALALISIISAAFGKDAEAVAVGLAAIAMAVLATREP